MKKENNSFDLLNHIFYLLFLGSGLQINTFFAILTLKINDQSNRTQEIDLVLREDRLGDCKFCEVLLQRCRQVKMMTKRNRNIKNIFIKLQLGTNIMANEVKTPIHNYFEKVLYENLTFQIPPLLFFRVLEGNKIVTSPCGRSRRPFVVLT